MQILVCAATAMEIAPLIQQLSVKSDHTVKLLVTGVGLLACSYALTKELSSHRPDLVVQAGVAGSLQPGASLAGVVAVRQETIGDLGVTEGSFQSVFDLHLLSPSAAPWQGGKLVNDNELLAVTGLPLVTGVTVNEITTNEARIHYYRHHLEAEVESMEGAALHYIGLMEKIPFLQIRSLSNFVGERDKSKWQLHDAIAALHHALQTLLTKLDAA